jgi:hypothetical protein
MYVRLPSFADPANLVTREEPKQPVIPKGITAPELAEMVMRGEVKLTPQKMRAMIELLPFHAQAFGCCARCIEQSGLCIEA